MDSNGSQASSANHVASAPSDAATTSGQGAQSAGAKPSGPVLPPRPVKRQASQSKSRSDTAEPAAASSATAPTLQSASSSNDSATNRTSASGTPSSSTRFMPTLPARPTAPTTGPVLDPDEPESVQKIRQRIHDVRVSLIRAAQRLGYDADNAIVRQVLYRLSLAEKLKAPWRRSSRRPDPNQVAAREAARLEASEPSAADAAGTSSGVDLAGLVNPTQQPLGFSVRMMLVGLAGVGKTQLVYSLLGSDSVPGGPQSDGTLWPAVDPISGATGSTRVYKGTACGIPLEVLDTPGLVVSASATGYNNKILQQIRRSYQSFKPDLVVYVDRLDAGGAARWNGDLPALQGLSKALGPATWLNTVVALSHAGAAPPLGAKGAPLPWDQWANQRSHVLQQVIRLAAGDNRLMNPTAFIETHPGARRDSSGQPLLYSGVPWRPHLLLMVVSAKLLSDTENMLQDGEMSQPGAAAAAAQQQLQLMQMMGAQPRTLPLPYIMSQMTQFSQPLKYPDHDQVMAVRRTEQQAAATSDPRQKKALVRQAKGLRLQIKQAIQYKEKMARSFRMATLAGSKITPVPPPIASKRPPSVHPPGTFRYRVPEPSGGWTVRPSIEPHGMDSGDGIEGLQMEQYSVFGRPKPRHKKKAKTKHLDAAAPAAAAAAASPATPATTATPTTSGASSSQHASTSQPHSTKPSQPASTATTTTISKPAQQPPQPPQQKHQPTQSGQPQAGPSNTQGGPQASAQGGKATQGSHAGQPSGTGTGSGGPSGSSPSQSHKGTSEKQDAKEESEGGADSVQLGGVPVHHYLSAQANKGHITLQARSETTLYQDPVGRTTTALSADLQATRTGPEPVNSLVTLRADMRRKAVPLLPGGQSNRCTGGVLLTRLFEGGKVQKGPLAIGGRLQNTFRATLGGRRNRARKGRGVSLLVPQQQSASQGMPMDVAAAVGVLFAPWGCASETAAASLAAMGAPPVSTDPEVCMGGNLEVTAEAQGLLGTRRSAPLTFNANMVSYKGDVMAGVAASLQVQGSRKDACATRLQLSNKGKAGLSIKVRSGPWWWTGLVAMAVPLINLIRETLGSG